MRGIFGDVARRFLPLVFLAAAAWGVTVQMSADFYRYPAVASRWETVSFGALFAMWAVMMTAMMLPSACPMLKIYARYLNRRRWAARLPCAMMTLGYLGAWLLFCVVVAALQNALGALNLIDHEKMALSGGGGWLLIVAGGYQFSPQKRACLNGCKSPALFLLLHWRAGWRGAFLMGAHNGLYCVGCCWLLMLLLFVGGVMNLAWIVALSVFAVAEKTLRLSPSFCGGVLIAWGIVHCLVY